MSESSALTDNELALIYRWPEELCFRLNLLIGPNGNISGEDGTSLSLTSPEDRRILRIIRHSADVVIVGAESVRKEGWFFPPQGRLIVLSHSGSLPMETCPHPHRVFVASSVKAILHNLRPDEHRILCEGGLTTARALHEHLGFDEIALSNSGSIEHVPDFLDVQDYDLVSNLSDNSTNITFRFWRRAAKPH
jgi:hypothetical protein